MKKTQFGAVALIIILFAAAMMVFVLPQYEKKIEIPKACTIDADCPAGYECRNDACIQVIIEKPSKCDMRSTQKPELRVAVRNPRNSTATDYQTGTVRIYEIANGIETYKGTLTVNTTGFQPKGTGFATECDKNYAIYLPASDTSFVSARTETTADVNDKTVTMLAADQAGFVVRIYDEDARGYVWGNASASDATHTASSWWDTDPGDASNICLFWSTTSNTSALTVDTNGWYTYTIYMKINSSTIAQYQDKELLLAFDRQSSDDWQKASSITFGEGVNVKVTSVDCPTKVSNLGFEDCFDLTEEVNSETIPLKITDSQRSVTITQYAISGVNPDDDIIFAFFTKGYFANILDEGMGNGYYKDDASKTLVYVRQQCELQFD